MSSNNKKRVFSGVQPTGSLHLGNYLGAIKNFVNLQNDFDCLYCIVDLHAITVWQNPEDLRANILDVASAYLACGIDPTKSTIFVQSAVPYHAELSWIFNCISRVGWLNRMTQFKEKAGKNKENMSIGLYTYPILMAADILAYKATHVPVGEDQKQHIELSRDIAQKFNTDYKDRINLLTKNSEFFVLPKPLINGPVPRVMSLRDGKKKMSSSDLSDMSRINIMDDEDQIFNKIRKSKTDSGIIPSDISELDNRPELRNLISIYSGISKQSHQNILNEFSGEQFSKLKKYLTDILIAEICPIGHEMKKLISDPSYIDSILLDGAEKARAISKPILAETKKIIGLA